MFVNITKEKEWDGGLGYPVLSLAITPLILGLGGAGAPFLAAFRSPLSSREGLQGQEVLSVPSLCPLQPGRSRTCLSTGRAPGWCGNHCDGDRRYTRGQ